MKADRLVLLLAGLAAGCSGVDYYAQAISGHFELMHRTQPIEEKLAAPATPPALRARLARAVKVRDYASRELGLPDNGSYRRYADLGRPFAVWNVFAAPELSTEPVQSCFPIAGCVTYRGYYGEADANDAAAALAQRGYDVFVGGVPAYSTLGWFDDPVLNTFIQYPDAELARLVFHELAHQVAYVRDDTAFNESFAVAVEQAGVDRWLAAHGSEADRRSYATQQARRREFLALVMDYRGKLARAYAQDGSAETRRAEKRRLFAEMHADYEATKARWGGWGGYDRWFAKGVNNANLASVAAYTELVPAFDALLAREGGDLPKFYAAVKALATLPKAERDAALAALAPGATR